MITDIGKYDRVRFWILVALIMVVFVLLSFTPAKPIYGDLIFIPVC